MAIFGEENFEPWGERMRDITRFKTIDRLKLKWWQKPLLWLLSPAKQDGTNPLVTTIT